MICLASLLLLLALSLSNVDAGSYTSAQCNGQSTTYLSGSSGTLDVTRYGSNADCRWHITVPENKVPLLKLKRIDVKREGSCKDRLRFYDARGAATYYLCGTSNNVPSRYAFTSGDRTLIVRITSNNVVNGGGFKAEWTSVNSEDVLCTGVKQLSAGSGEISSNPGTYTYANNANCAWNITAPVGKKVKLSFRSFKVPFPDQVTVHDGPSRSSQIMASMSGSRARSQTSTGRNMYVTFISNNIGAVEGFRARYQAV